MTISVIPVSTLPKDDFTFTSGTILLAVDGDTVSHFEIEDRGFRIPFNFVCVELPSGIDMTSLVSSPVALRSYFSEYNLIYQNRVSLRRVLKHGYTQTYRGFFVGYSDFGEPLYSEPPLVEKREALAGYTLSAYVAKVPDEYFIGDICD